MDTIRLLVLNKGLIMEPYITFSKDIDNYLKSLTSNYGTFNKEFEPTETEYTLVLDKYESH